MKVRLKYKKKDGTIWALKREITIKEAKTIFEKELKNDNNIVEVYLTRFDGWYNRKIKTLKRGK